MITDPTFWDILSKFIGTIGVPAAIAFFALWRLNGKLGLLVNNIAELNKNIAVMAEKGEDISLVGYKVEKVGTQLDIWEERWRNQTFTGWKTPSKDTK